MPDIADAANALMDVRLLAFAFITLCCFLGLHAFVARKRLSRLHQRVDRLERRVSVVTNEFDGMMMARLRQNDQARPGGA